MSLRIIGGRDKWPSVALPGSDGQGTGQPSSTLDGDWVPRDLGRPSCELVQKLTNQHPIFRGKFLLGWNKTSPKGIKVRRPYGLKGTAREK